LGYTCEIQVIISGHFGRGSQYTGDYNRRFQCFELVPHERLLTFLAASGVESRLFVWLRNVLVGRTQRVTGGVQIFKDVKVTSGVTQITAFDVL
jgi:hypothetical protein